MLTLLPDLNIAPLKYAHVHREHGGPVHSLSYVEKELPEGKFFEAFVFLDEKNTGLKKLSFGPHGQALALDKAEAIYGAISNAIEQWAWLACSQSAEGAPQARLDLDPSPHGFAAFPGLGVQGARKRALFEAAEKWNICSWWEGKLTHVPMKMPHAIQIQTPIVGLSTVINWTDNPRIYGIGTAPTPSLAWEKAKRNRIQNSETLKQEKTNPRILKMRYFSQRDGQARFEARLKETGQKSSAPQLLVDIQIHGPWQQYAHVWRCLFDASSFHEKDREDYFFL